MQSVYNRSYNIDENKFKDNLMKINLHGEKGAPEKKQFPTVTLKDEKIHPNTS
jgi:hypothetical protein